MPELGHQGAQFPVVVNVVEAQGGEADDVDGRLFGFALRQGALLAGFFDVELNNLLQGCDLPPAVRLPGSG